MQNFKLIQFNMALQSTINPNLKRACDYYNLGTPVSISEIKGGDENYNYLIETNKGKYVKRELGSKLTEEKKGLLALEFRVLNELRKKDFPFHLPTPIQNSDNSILDKDAGNPYWVYSFLEGESYKLNKTNVAEIAKTLATYHSYVSQIPIEKNRNNLFASKWLKQKFEEMSSVGTHSKLDIEMKSRLHFFKDILEEVSQIEYTDNQLPTHGDFAPSNLLFDSHGRVNGILDFDDIRIAPKIKDIANSILYFCYEKTNFDTSKYQVFLEAYKNRIAIDREEEELIVPAMLTEFCSIFSWYYDSNKKNHQTSLTGIKEIHKKTKSLLGGK